MSRDGLCQSQSTVPACTFGDVGRPKRASCRAEVGLRPLEAAVAHHTRVGSLEWIGNIKGATPFRLLSSASAAIQHTTHRRHAVRAAGAAAARVDLFRPLPRATRHADQGAEPHPVMRGAGARPSDARPGGAPARRGRAAHRGRRRRVQGAAAGGAVAAAARAAAAARQREPRRAVRRARRAARGARRGGAARAAAGWRRLGRRAAADERQQVAHREGW
ncbi:hypothetical protein FGB62_73g118 [Gracilaria domingensis]|nr:hypothetical protein FGB62_73g118 [Gracilaria domingensis]